MGVVIAEDGEYCDEGIEGKEGADDGEDEWWEEPRGRVAVGRVEGVVDAQEVVEFGHRCVFSWGKESLRAVDWI